MFLLSDLSIELRKLKGTLVVVLCLVAPSLAVALMALLCIRNGQMPWQAAMMNAIPIWAFFILPMTLAALSALLAQLEHGPRLWDHLLTLPVARWRIFTAKGLVMALLTGVMSVVMLAEMRLTGAVLHSLMPLKAPIGAFPWKTGLILLGQMWGASLCMAMIQLWVALSFRSFVAPLTLGMAGTFCAIAVMGADEALFVPWVMPIKIVTDHGAQAPAAVGLSLAGALMAFIAMTWHLSRKEA